MTEEQTPQPYDIVVHKIWRRGRFASFNYWAQGNKVVIDIGEFGKDNKLTSNTKCYVDLLPFYTYLSAEHDDRITKVYPSFDKDGYSIFGGSANIARIWKSHWWMNGDTPDYGARVFKCGHFKGKPSSTGAVIADMSQPLSLSSIKLSLEELDHVYHSLNALVMLRPNTLLNSEVIQDG